jgi:hypothetical protein
MWRTKDEVSECLQTKAIARKRTRLLLRRALFASPTVDLVNFRTIEHELADLTCELERVPLVRNDSKLAELGHEVSKWIERLTVHQWSCKRCLTSPGPGGQAPSFVAMRCD